MGSGRGRRRLALVVAAVVAGAACARLDRRLVAPERVQTLDDDSPYLKVHMKNGELYLLSGWSVGADRRSVHGVGTRFDANREPLGEGTFRVGVEEVALFETNVAKRPRLWAWLTLVTGASVALTIYCLENHKACFGSCPTFYVEGDGPEASLVHAEGFSASIAPALEARDVDALYRARPASRTLVVRVTNEALETHVIRYANVLAAGRPPGGRVFATPDARFFAATALREALSCEAGEGRCTDAVRHFDGIERRSVTDPDDLGARESIVVELPPSHGIAIAARQTFVTTFLLYQALAYLGTRAGDVLASLARADGSVRDSLRRIRALLGDIEVEAWIDGAWVRVGAFTETGPIATDVQLVVLPAVARDAGRFRLRAAQGHWRIDWIAGVELGGEVTPIAMAPRAVRSGAGPEPDALARLLDPADALTTLPGDEYTLEYALPGAPERYELFLDARGYYLEWMRREWIAEENPIAAAMMLFAPEAALRALAPAFKRIEPSMEDAFWGSRYAKP